MSELTDGKIWICRLLVLLELAKSNNEARRLIQQGGVTLGPGREKITDENLQVQLSNGLIVRVGNRRVVQVLVA